ncbi:MULTISPECIES: hypothetical protein [unclassified Carboxylicivirga]|uniref:hypothetical protein n=1 Tax=Carboxylicivirga TaxID=1628153 RepID=UPI003D3571D5
MENVSIVLNRLKGECEPWTILLSDSKHNSLFNRIREQLERIDNPKAKDLIKSLENKRSEYPDAFVGNFESNDQKEQFSKDIGAFAKDIVIQALHLV